MVRIRIALVVVVCACLAAQAQIPKSEYRERRQALRKALGDAVLALAGHTDRDEDLRSGFFQQPDFLYLTGLHEPNAMLLLTPAGETLFLPKHNPAAEKYTGRKAAPDDADVHEVTGFDQVAPVEQFETQFAKALEQHARVFTLTGEAYAAKLKALAPLREFGDAARQLATLREKKSPAELALIQKATDVSVRAHEAAWKRIVPGLYEYQVAATMLYTMGESGCQHPAYTPIVGGGPDATILHYSANTRRMDAGELLLMDVGAECSDYATDITRTVPVSGEFTPRQRELYEVVLGAQQAALAAVKPGIVMGATRTTPNSLYKVAFDYISAHGKDRNGKPLGDYLLHGISHHVGLEVHDAPAFSYSEPLEAGMVITVEPGIYIPDEGIGIRIEDTVLVTENGAKVLSDALPRDPDVIEKVMGRK